MSRSSLSNAVSGSRPVVALTWTLFVAVLFVGCATFNNTLAQDRVWAAEAVCKAEVPDFRLTRVDPDGRYWMMTNEAGSLPRAQECMRQQLQAWRGSQPQSARATSNPAVSGAAVAVAPLKEVQLPTWKIGDEWAYRYQGAAGNGTYVWSVVRTDTMDGTECYVLKTGERELFYRKQDLAYVGETVSGVVVRRATPPKPDYQWPLTIGGKWQHKYTNENPRDRQTREVSSEWEVVGQETVTVPAGTFETMKVVARDTRTGNRLYELWHAPGVKQWVKIHEWREAGEQIRELIAYKLR